MKKLIDQELKKNPLRIYDTIVFLSCQLGGTSEQDFVMIGDPEAIAKHFAVMLNRHEQFKEMVLMALHIELEANEQLNKIKNNNGHNKN